MTTWCSWSWKIPKNLEFWVLAKKVCQLTFDTINFEMETIQQISLQFLRFRIKIIHTFNNWRIIQFSFSVFFHYFNRKKLMINQRTMLTEIDTISELWVCSFELNWIYSTTVVLPSVSMYTTNKYSIIESCFPEISAINNNEHISFVCEGNTYSAYLPVNKFTVDGSKIYCIKDNLWNECSAYKDDFLKSIMHFWWWMEKLISSLW